MVQVTIWNEFILEKEDEQVKKLYPLGIHKTLADTIEKNDDMTVKTATLDQPEHGLSEQVLNETDVLVWWGHKAHKQVRGAVVERVRQRVLQGMGLIVLHSSHFSKIFKSLMGTNCTLKWRIAGEKEKIWTVEPAHPIAKGIPDCFEIEQEEMYGERFDIPAPEKTVFISWFEGGEVFRSGCCWQRGDGKVFYFRPGHESYPTYYHKTVLKIITNAIRWAQPI